MSDPAVLEFIEQATDQGARPARDAFDFDMLVLGSGPAGQRAAIQAAKLGKRTAIVERRAVIGGVCINTGTIPSKTLREAVLYLSGYREKNIYGASYAVKSQISMSDLLFRADHVIRNEIDVTNHQLRRNGINVLAAKASFVGDHEVRLEFFDGSGVRDVTAQNIVIAVGREVVCDPSVPVDGQCIFTSDDVLHLKDLPRTIAVVGAGVIGLEYATMFAALGVRVTLIDKRDRLLPFVDHEIIDALVYHMRQNRVTMRLGEEVEEVARVDGDQRVRITLASGKRVNTEKALYCIGRQGATADLKLDAAGLTANHRGLLNVDENYRTEAPHIYAVGDVIGFPSLASTSMEQGRLAACDGGPQPRRALPLRHLHHSRDLCGRVQRRRPDARRRALRGGQGVLPRDRPWPDHRRFDGHAEADVPPRQPQAPGRGDPGGGRVGADPYRPGGARP